MIDRWLRVSFYEQLANGIRAKIDSGEWPPGRKLPSELTLMQEHGIARGTVRHAFDILRAEGLIVTFPGRGSFVAPRSDN